MASHQPAAGSMSSAAKARAVRLMFCSCVVKRKSGLDGICMLHRNSSVFWSSWSSKLRSIIGYLNDVMEYDPETKTWTDLSLSTIGSTPSPRDKHGFTSLGGVLFVHAGEGNDGEAMSEKLSQREHE